MDSKIGYKNIQALVQALVKAVEALEAGKMSAEALEETLEHARELHERIAVLRYLSHKKDRIQPTTAPTPDKKSTAPKEAPFTLDFSSAKPQVSKEPSKQTNLLDAIRQEEPNHINDVIEEETSVNEKFSDHANQETMADKLGKQAIKDLNESIGLNQKFLFMNDLFEGENNWYKEAITALNSFEDHTAATDYVTQLSARYQWDENGVTYQKFIALIERRYAKHEG